MKYFKQTITIASAVILCLLLTACSLLTGTVAEGCESEGHDYSEVIKDAEHLKESASNCDEKNSYWFDCSRCDANAKDDPEAENKWFESTERGPHTVSDEWTASGGFHFKKCTGNGCSYTEATDTCSGGSASCVSMAVCSICSNEYGSLGNHTFDMSTWGYKDESGHAHLCIYCDAHDRIVAHTPAAPDSSDAAHLCCSDPDCKYPISDAHIFTVLKTNDNEHWYECSVCGAEKQGSRAAHSGGNATCEASAVCAVCDIAYGNKAEHSYEKAVITAAATFTEGLEKHTCTSCGDSYEKTVPATRSLKILSIGNSFSQDAMEHLYIVCKDAGIETLVLGNLIKGGCSLYTHLSLMTNNTDGYFFYISSDEKKGMTKVTENATAKFALDFEDWDFITLQQSSPNSGKPDTYSYLDGVIDYVNEHKNESAKLVWHMTWAYQANSTHSSFPDYGNNQMTMYNAILSAVDTCVLDKTDFVCLIPNGTAIQNLRTSHLGDNLTRDGYHLSLGIGRYTAALTYLAAITGYDIDGITATPASYPEVKDHLDCIKEAVKNAINSPYTITKSSYPPEDKILDTTLSELAAEDREFLIANGYNPDRYMLLDLEITENSYYNSTLTAWSSKVIVTDTSHSFYYKYLTTQAFQKDELITGSIIRIDAGYQYRPDGWTATSKTASADRPVNVSENITVVDEAWWGNFEHRGFNISSTTSGKKLYASDGEVFRIYVPIAEHSALTEADKTYLTGLGLDHEEYEVLDFNYALASFYNSSSANSKVTSDGTAFTAQFLCTEILSKYDITLGSVIRITENTIKYRPEGWADLDKNNASRPGNVSLQFVIVDAAWWGDFCYRAFNVSRNDGSAVTDADAACLRIYVKITK